MRISIFNKWRIRRTKEKIAYWGARAEVFVVVCSNPHTRYDQQNLIEAVAKKKLYDTRLQCLMSNNDK